MNELLFKVNAPNIWDTQPVFCFTSDMDWASEAVLDEFFALLPYRDIKLTVFVTHDEMVGINTGLKRGCDE